MHGSTVVLVSFLTAALTTAGTVYVVERYNILPHQTVQESVVPDLHGMAETDARTNANAAHVALFVASREPSSDAKPGTVIRQSSSPGQHLPREAAVSVVLAEEVVKVPNVVNLTFAEASQKLEQRGYALQTGTTVADPKVPLGSVVSQTPRPDTVFIRGGVVTVQISSGPGDVDIPKLVGLPITQAKTDLEKLGLKPVIHWVALPETPTNVVLNQKPTASEKAKPGADVHLTVCSR